MSEILANLQKSDLDEYSTSERIIGTWIDGKPVYEKTIHYGTLPNTTGKNVAHGISNISKIVSIQGWASNGTIFMPLPTNSPLGITYSVALSADGTNISTNTGMDRTAWDAYVILRYTKTTN